MAKRVDFVALRSRSMTANGIDDTGASALGDALEFNTVLQTLQCAASLHTLCSSVP